MSSTSPPPEAQRYGRSQTPESPRPVHIPEPSNIPVLLNQMDPVFNNTATYNIPENQTFSPLPELSVEQTLQKPATDEHDAVQSFFREAEYQAAAEPVVSNVQTNVSDPHPQYQFASFPSVPTTMSDVAAQAEVSNDLSIPKEITEQESMQLGNRSVPLQNETEEQNATEQPLSKVETDQFPLQDQETSTSATDDNGGVDYQSLLDNISQSTSTSPTGESLIAPTTAVESSLGQTALPIVPGLPPKPPPQENPLSFASYLHPNVVQTQPNSEQPESSTSISGNVSIGSGQQSSSDIAQALNGPAVTSNGYATSLPPQPVTGLAPGQAPPQGSSEAQRSQDPLERPWSPRTQISYDQFLEEERRYVTEGIWDKFPIGSRLFVGNLPSEKVTKRDLFHKFHKHGKLAQISIKQAYGFVQFLEASSCLNALNAEQGVEIRGRKVHLEISKPQKNTRGAGSKNNQPQPRRRSRSPERNNRRNYSDFRDDSGRRSNDYRNRRSPSPRGYRSRDEYRPSSRNGRPRSPIYPPNYAVPSAAYDDEASLPLPRRDPRSAPDVQLLILEPDVEQSFINWVEQGFRMKGLQASTIWLDPRLPLAAVIKRQIIEGVQAVVKLTRVAQSNSKIPLQVFDRTAGASNVNFNEYGDLDLSVAADVVLQARMRERAPSQPLRPPSYPPQAGYGYGSQYSQQQQAPVPPQPSQYSASIPTHYQPPPTSQYPYPNQPNTYVSPGANNNQPPNLQQLLANLRQPGSQAVSPTTASHQSMNGIPGQSQYPPHSIVQPQSYGQYGSTAVSGYPTASQQSPHAQPNVQNIMDQLARYQR